MELNTEIAVIGGGLGGCAAALAALQMGRRVVMTEETDWIGGQLTSQAVPPDEHPWIEETGCTPTYRRLREGIRDYYRQHYPLKPPYREQVQFNPGNGFVSRLCHEPRVALAVLEGFFAAYRTSGQLTILLNTHPVAAETDGDRVISVTVKDSMDGEETVITAPFIIDATELGDLLELANVEHVIGAESQAQTNEMHALPGDADPLDQQAVTWCFAVDYLPGEDHTIPKPDNYELYRDTRYDFWPTPQLSWVDTDPPTMQPRTVAIFDKDNPRSERWRYRRILDKSFYPDGTFQSDISLINWPQHDYWQGALLGVSDEERAKHEKGAMDLSLSLLYWMQTEAPRHDGGEGYPGLRLRHDVMGTKHGLAKAIYIRESRRIQAEFTILEEHVGVAQRGDLVGAEVFDDSVGIGSYRIDLHPSTGGRSYIDIPSWPAQLPLGSMIPVRVENLLPANKNIGTTHITNGCYRLHPMEWNIGESAGHLAAYCLQNGLTPRQVRNDAEKLRDFQRVLYVDFGMPLEWPEYARRSPRDGTTRLWKLHQELNQDLLIK